jgi:hypothetical protein
MYGSRAFSITTRNAIALLFLSQVFQVMSLQVEVEEFIEKDVKLSNFGHYMSETLFFNNEKVALKVLDTCEDEVMQLCSNQQGLSWMLKGLIASSVLNIEEKGKNAWSFLMCVPKAIAAPIARLPGLQKPFIKG